MELKQVAPPTRLTQEASSSNVEELRNLMKVGRAVILENGLHELMVPAIVEAITDDTFTVRRGKQKTVCQFASAWFVKDGEKLILGDNDHCYSHVV